MEKTYEDYGIILDPSNGNVEQSVLCPECSAGRKKKHGKCLSVNIQKKMWHCHNCFWGGSLGGNQEPIKSKHKVRNIFPVTMIELQIDDEGSAPIREYFEQRGISADTLKMAGVTGQTLRIHGRLPVCRLNYWYEGSRVFIKNTECGSNSSGKRRQWVQKGGHPIPYNIDAMAYRGFSTVIITEGEIDCLSMMEVGYTAVVSIPMGALPEKAKRVGTKLDWLHEFLHYFTGRERVILALDNDPAGIRTRTEIAKIIGIDRCRYIVYPEGCKDTNSVLMKYGYDEARRIIRDAVDNALPVPPPTADVAELGVDKTEEISSWLIEQFEFRLNSMTNGIEWRDADSLSPLSPFSLDYDLSSLTYRISIDTGSAVSPHRVEMVIRHLANEAKYHPVRDYLDHLEWDGLDHLKQLLGTIETNNDELFREFFTRWFVNVIATTYGASKNEQVLVLQGDQYDGKTWFFEHLLPKNHLTLTSVMDMFDPNNKDHRLLTTKRMLVVLDEMAAYDRADLATLKAFISQDEFDLRKAYGRDDRRYHRMASLAGCVNAEQFLRDPTGDRRFLVFTLIRRDHNGYDAVNKEQLLAQIVHLFQSGYDYKFSRADIMSVIAKNRSQYTRQTTDEVLLDDKIVEDANSFLTAGEIIQGMKERNHVLRMDPNTLSQYLKNRGIRPCRQRQADGTQPRGYRCRFADEYPKALGAHGESVPSFDIDIEI